MNKAFVREPDGDDVLCPRCRSLGESVLASAFAAATTVEQRRQLAERVFFCPAASCPVAYFDALESAIEATALPQPVYPKDPTAPLCGCFGLKLEDIEDDLAEGAPRRIRELLAKSKSPAAYCATASPTGRCCMPEVQRVYFKLRGGTS
ncbi:hypothetical protein [Anatilimnocola floriformis]|uniref:hypothetical protein n=1 Tax=Anatilimnocola floriformis TaxID=2948575 RepID=UPI0020C4C740|nr:hypothetical protein [Anatilimnocola floriformis]